MRLTRLTAAPVHGRRLSEGALVEASVRARVLGIPLLRLEATVALVPAEYATPFRAAQGTPARPSARSSGTPPARSGGNGGLAQAVRSINEGAAVLAEVRRNGS